MIEVDGAAHAGRETEDAARTRLLKGEGYRVIRFWNNDVMGNIEGVIQSVAVELSGAAR